MTIEAERGQFPAAVAESSGGRAEPTSAATGRRARRPRRRIGTAVVLAVGSELTTGATRDTNAAELAAALSGQGVDVVGIGLLPDRLEIVTAALEEALERADLVVTTGGLGPTPDDLTREAIAAVCGEAPVVDRRLEAALRRRWLRRRLPYPASNVKQAWLIPSARPIPNPNGTAPGWWIERPDGRLVVALPGPPRELHPMWRDWVLPRLRRLGLGARQVVRTLRTVGIGESQLAELLGEGLLRAANPRIATYARQDAVDIVITARDEPSRPGSPRRSARALAAEAEAAVRSRLGDAVWGTDEDTWSGVVGRLLAERGWRLAVVELGTAGSLLALLEPLTVEGALARADVRGLDAESRGPNAETHRAVEPQPPIELPPVTEAELPAEPVALAAHAEAIRTAAGVDVGLAVQLAPTGPDTAVAVAVVDPAGSCIERRTVFGGGPQARLRAAVAAADVLRRRFLAVAIAEPSGSPGP